MKKQVNDNLHNQINPDGLLNQQEEFSSPVLPVLDYLNDSAQQSQTSRRDFLKTMGFSVSAAALVASCKIPVKKALPYVNQPEHITPGKALYYASSYFDGRNFSNILVKTRDGRPIKVDGNPDSPFGNGSSAVQASVISLYDHTRFQGPMMNGESSSWEEVDGALKRALKNTSKKVVLLSGPVISPSLKGMISQFSANNNAKHVVYSATGSDALLEASEEQFGIKAAPSFKFADSDVIVSFAADFLGSWMGGQSFYATDYGLSRKVSKDNPKMSRHYQVESMMSLTGSNADYRKAVKPSQVKAALFQLLNALAGKMGASKVSGIPDVLDADFIAQVASDLAAAKGKSLVLCGLDDKEAQKATNAINAMLGNIGKTIDYGQSLNTIQSDAKGFASLLADMKAGRVGVLLTHNVNPVFNSSQGAAFAEALKNVDTVASFDLSPNETNEFANLVLPDSHYLESWADYEPVKGVMSMAQPVIQPLFDTRSFGDSMAKFAGFTNDNGDNYIEAAWKNTFGDNFNGTWKKAISSGFMKTEGASSSPSFSVGSLNYTPSESGDIEVLLYEDKLGAGEHSGNPYMQELPDPVTKISWDNYAAVSPKFAKEQGIYVNRNVNPAKKGVPVITVTANGNSIDLPVLVQPGVAYGTVAIPRGYGKTKGGLVGLNIGVNPNGLTANQFAAASISKTGKSHDLANSQVHYTINDDRPIIREATLDQYKENQQAGNEFRYTHEFEHAIEPTLYAERKFPAHHWGMNVDLNACFGCGACVVSCNVENNIPVVGKREMANNREMHWLRIDRYFASENQDPKSPDYMEDPKAVFMPMMCQHCDNAPCENVCPVNATNHSSEGLNQMAYNRCIGTRYCANNCPFKVRRFNWFDYWGADAWGPGNDHKYNDVNANMRDDFSRMILNPDVTVRSRGVIEKCSFCVQRIQEAKLDAKINNEALGDNAIKTACQSACPTNAIVFGDTNNKESNVHNLMQDDRNYYVLEEFHILPSVGYLTKITNSDNAMFDKSKDGIWKQAIENHNSHGDGHGGGHGEGSGESHGVAGDGHGTESHGTKTEEHH